MILRRYKINGLIKMGSVIWQSMKIVVAFTSGILKAAAIAAEVDAALKVESGAVYVGDVEIRLITKLPRCVLYLPPAATLF